MDSDGQTDEPEAVSDAEAEIARWGKEDALGPVLYLDSPLNPGDALFVVGCDNRVARPVKAEDVKVIVTTADGKKWKPVAWWMA